MLGRMLWIGVVRAEESSGTILSSPLVWDGELGSGGGDGGS